MTSPIRPQRSQMRRERPSGSNRDRITQIAWNGTDNIVQILKGEATCDRFGKTMAFTTARLFKEGGETVARGSHTKFTREAWKDERNVVEELKDL